MAIKGGGGRMLKPLEVDAQSAHDVPLPSVGDDAHSSSCCV